MAGKETETRPDGDNSDNHPRSDTEEIQKPKAMGSATRTNETNDTSENNTTFSVPFNYLETAVFRRFTDPVIDDPGLPLTDVLVAQVIAPSLQIAWLGAAHAPQPTWLQPIVDPQVLLYGTATTGTLVAPTLIHGAALATCWIGGALAARAYERASISPVRRRKRSPSAAAASAKASAEATVWDYSAVIQAILRAGAFATGLLLLATQTDLFLEYHGRWIQLGESEETDFRLLVGAVELINDVVFEAVTLTAWRLFLAYQTERLAREDEEQ